VNKLLPTDLIAAIPTYREAVRACWAHRRRVNMTARQLAEEAVLYASHVSDYLSADETRRDLPARHIPSVEAVCENHVITQWLAHQSALRVERKVA
jgi:hypothetical protein